VRCAAFVQALERMNDGVSTTAYGGYEDTERKTIAFNIHDVMYVNFPIVPIAITYNEKFSKAPTHRDYLGTVMYVSEEVTPFIAENLDQVGRVTVAK